MASQAQCVPAESDLLCEACGYTLSGLPEHGNCPECGDPIGNSLPTNRRPASKEFFARTWEIMFHPTRFFRSTVSRGSLGDVKTFAFMHWAIAAFLLCLATFLHAQWYENLSGPSYFNPNLTAALLPVYFALLIATSSLAARLTAWEARYRGLRMPRSAIHRALYFHAAHYLPPAMLGLATVIAFRIWLYIDIKAVFHAQQYLYVLCCEVIFSAVYLFQTYWIAMRSIRYANA